MARREKSPRGSSGRRPRRSRSYKKIKKIKKKIKRSHKKSHKDIAAVDSLLEVSKLADNKIVESFSTNKFKQVKLPFVSS